jgi:hypothetical protein
MLLFEDLSLEEETKRFHVQFYSFLIHLSSTHISSSNPYLPSTIPCPFIHQPARYQAKASITPDRYAESKCAYQLSTIPCSAINFLHNSSFVLRMEYRIVSKEKKSITLTFNTLFIPV